MYDDNQIPGLPKPKNLGLEGKCQELILQVREVFVLPCQHLELGHLPMNSLCPESPSTTRASVSPTPLHGMDLKSRPCNHTSPMVGLRELL